MSEEKLSIRDIRDIIEMDGLGYAIQDYLSHTEIADDKLAKMWKRCNLLLNEIEEYVLDESVVSDDDFSESHEDDDEDDYED